MGIWKWSRYAEFRFDGHIIQVTVAFRSPEETSPATENHLQTLKQEEQVSAKGCSSEILCQVIQT